MNVFHKVTLATLKKNPTRTAVTVIGIMLSAAMICAVTTFVSSLRNYALENTVYREGSWHGSALSADREKLEKITSDQRVLTAVYGQQVGYAVAEGCKNDYKPYLYVLGISEGFEEIMPVHLSAGQMPKAQNEILLPEHLAENGGVSYKIGDVITLSLGDRVCEGEKIGQSTPFLYENVSGEEDEAAAEEKPEEIRPVEELTFRESRTYLVVGFYERPQFEAYTAPGYTALTAADGTDGGQGTAFDVYYQMQDPSEVYVFMEELALEGKANTDVLTLMGSFQYGSIDAVLWNLAVIITGLIMFGSVALIYNAFSISVSERTKQFGLLSSVGATKRQLCRSVFFEAAAVSAVGIPLGIIAGIGGIGITLMIIGNRFTVLFGYNIPMRISVSLPSVIVAAVVAWVTVLISAWIPSRRAMKVSAVEAIRQNNDVRPAKRAERTPKIIYKIFGLPGVLADKYYKRNRKKYRATVVSLFMSIVLFVSASAFTEYLTDAAGVGWKTRGFDVSFHLSESWLNDGTPEDLLIQISGEGIEGQYIIRQRKTGKAPIELFSEQIRESSEEEIRAVDFMECYVPDEEFRRILKDTGRTEEDYFDPASPLALILDGTEYFDKDEEKYRTRHTFDGEECTLQVEWIKEMPGYRYDGYGYEYAGNKYEDEKRVFHYVSLTDEKDVLSVPEEEAVEIREMTGKGRMEQRPYYLPDGGVCLVYPLSTLEALHPDTTQYNTYYYFLKGEDHGKIYEKAKTVLLENGIPASNLQNYSAQDEEERNMVTIIEVFSYGFIVLISLIAAANVFNTISTNVALRRREFAMLKSVGMTSKGFNRMMNYECILYGVRALLWGLPASAGVSFLIFLAVNEGIETPFRMPWKAIGIAVAFVFSVVFATMMYAMKKIKKEDPIQGLKNENL